MRQGRPLHTDRSAFNAMDYPEEHTNDLNTGMHWDRATLDELYKDVTYVHEQMVVSATWTVTHNLDKYPAVTVVDSAGTVVIGEIKYLDNNHLTLTFSGQFSGKAYLN